MRTLTVTNWTRWQSYRSDRGQPPWIKVHRTLLRNPEWTTLTNAERGQLVQIWILAADKGGVIEVPDYVSMETFIKGVCCMNEDVDLEVLRRLGFISLDAKVTPTRRQPDVTLASQSREEESRGETETETERLAAAPPPLTGPRICPPNKKHAWCDGRMHVPRFVHEEFQRISTPEFDLLRWYAVTDLAWADKTIGDDAPTFWRARWREEHGTTQQTDAQIKRQAQQKRDRASEQPL